MVGGPRDTRKMSYPERALRDMRKMSYPEGGLRDMRNMSYPQGGLQDMRKMSYPEGGLRDMGPGGGLGGIKQICSVCVHVCKVPKNSSPDSYGKQYSILRSLT